MAKVIAVCTLYLASPQPYMGTGSLEGILGTPQGDIVWKRDGWDGWDSWDQQINRQ